mgnify:CR=1 FL=1
MKGHFAATRARFAASHGPILLIQDTTEFAYQRGASSLLEVRDIDRELTAAADLRAQAQGAAARAATATNRGARTGGRKII